MEPTQNDGEIPTKVKLGASYKWFPEKLESAECRDNFFVFFFVFIQVQNMLSLAWIPLPVQISTNQLTFLR